MSITIKELISNPHLKTKVIAGEKGLNNEISWAHSCELKDPSFWLVGGELILTNGLAIPPDAQGQIKYIKNLMDHHVSGLNIGEDLHCPELSDEMLSFANEHGFPILSTSYEITWLAISKTVVMANEFKQYTNVTNALKLYDLVRKHLNNFSFKKLLTEISHILSIHLTLTDTFNNRILYQTNRSEPYTPQTKENIEKNIVYADIPIPASRPMKLNISPIQNETIDSIIINHLSTVIGLIAENHTAYYERERRIGAEIFLELIEGQYNKEIATSVLEKHDLHDKNLQLIACKIDADDYSSSWFHIRLYEQKIPHLTVIKKDTLFILLPSISEIFSILKNELPTHVQFGISRGKIGEIDVKRLSQEAIWALRSAITLNRKLVYYEENLSISPFIPYNREDAINLVKGTLGPLIDYDTKKNSNLIKTLFIFLSENQSWKKTSEILFIHKQTLIYRVQRIEKILGKKLNHISNISEIWIAFQTAIALDILPDLTDSLS